MLSPHSALAEHLRAAVAAWGSLPSGFAVERTYNLDAYIGGWTDAAPGKIVCMPSAVEALRVGRNQDQDDITISVVYLRKLTALNNTQADAADLETHQLRVFLKSMQKIAADGVGFSRVNTALPTPYAADIIRSSEIFASVIQCVYRTYSEVAA
jgi:hypothetical protein